jgi:hypothetical protein
MYTLLLAPNTPTQQSSRRMHAVSEVNKLLPDIPITDLRRAIEDKELAYFLAQVYRHGIDIRL